MAITLEMYSGFSKKLNSTKQPSGSGTAVQAVMKDNTSIISPHFIIHAFNTSYNYIKWGSRYYFVDDIILLSNNMAEYVCRTDVLATFKAEIAASSQYVTRAATGYNLFIADTKYPARSENVIENLDFSTLHSELVNGGSFVLGVANGINVESAGVSYYCLTPLEMRQLLDFMFGGTWLNATDISQDLQKELVNPFQYIDSLTWYPFDIPNSDVPFNPENIHFGYWDSGIVGGLLNANNASKGFAQTLTLPSHSQISRGWYLNTYPYTRISLDCYSFGMIPIDSADLQVDTKLTLGLSIDFLTGMGKLTLRAGTDAKLIYKQFAKIGVPMKISQVTQDLIGAFTNTVGGALNIAYGNFLGYTAGILSGLNSLMPQITSSGTNGTKAAFTTAPTLIITRKLLADEDLTQFGRPLCQQIQIGSLSGYILCENADLDTAASPIEKESIVSFLDSGFYYE